MKRIVITMLGTAAILATCITSCSCRNSSGTGEDKAAAEAKPETAALPQEKLGDIEFDRTIHNFGDVMLSDGPLSCTFTLKNTGSKPTVIYNVVTSCGCTDVKWTKEPILPGQTGTISATYSNDEGPYPFDKALTAYISGVNKPVILRIRGISHEKQLSIEEMYPIRIDSSVGIKSLELKCGNIEQGGRRSDEVNIANLSRKPAEVTFKNVSDNLSIRVEPNPIPPRQTARLTFTVTADRSIWGKNLYYATPVIDGKESKSRLSVYAFTKESFNDMTEEERKTGAKPIFNTNTFSAGKIKAGTKIDAEYQFSNAGERDFVIYKIDIDHPSSGYELPDPVKPGTKGKIRIHLDTTGLPEGEMLISCTLTTNSPSRPIVNLYIAGWIE